MTVDLPRAVTDPRTSACPQYGAPIAEVAVVCPRCGRRDPLGLRTRRGYARRSPMPYPTVKPVRGRFGRWTYLPTQYVFAGTWILGMRGIGLLMGVGGIVLVRLIPIAPAARLAVYVSIPVLAVILVFGEGPYRRRQGRKAWRNNLRTAKQCPVCGHSIPAGVAACSYCGALR